MDLPQTVGKAEVMVRSCLHGWITCDNEDSAFCLCNWLHRGRYLATSHCKHQEPRLRACSKFWTPRQPHVLSFLHIRRKPQVQRLRIRIRRPPLHARHQPKQSIPQTLNPRDTVREGPDLSTTVSCQFVVPKVTCSRHPAASSDQQEEKREE